MRSKVITIIIGFYYYPLLTFLWLKDSGIILADVERLFQFQRTPFKGVMGVLYLLIHDKYFRNVFFCRMDITNCILRRLYPLSDTFFMGNNVGPGLYAAHPFATIINVKKTGKNLSIRNSTTIGNKNTGRNDECPTIGDNVTIGANVCVIGNITIGNNVTIGAGSIVVKDIPDNAIVVGNPSRIIGYNNINN